MTVFAGGVADKFGNQYESWWTICRVLDVLHGHADWIRLEPLGAEGDGVEFGVRAEGSVRWDQVKSSTSSSSWGPARLAAVVSKVEGQLLTGDAVRLVAAVPAGETVKKLLATVHSMSSAGSSQVTVPAGMDEPIDEFAKALGREREEAVRLLGRFTFAHKTPGDLEDLVHSRVDHSLLGDPVANVRTLHGWLFSQVRKTLYTDEIIHEWAKLGLTARPRLGDTQTAASLAATAQAFADRLSHTRGPQKLIARDAAKAAVAHITGATRTVVLHGPPGVGKSNVVEQVIDHEDLETWRKAVIRLDTLDGMAVTPDQLGKAFGLTGSPATLLGDLCGTEPSLLVIDQLDAVSTFSGRVPESFQSVERLLSSAPAWPSMRVLLAVRTVDLENDQRLAAIADAPGTVEVPIAKLTDDEVISALELAGIDRAGLDEAAFALVHNPLELGLLVEAHASLDDEGGTLTTARLLKAKEGHCRKTSGGSVQPWNNVLNSLARRLSDSEQLSVAEDSVSDLEPDLSHLVSTGLLTVDRGQVAFFHERYFDFVFARSFVTSGGDLTQFLGSGNQSLFRRAQVRQVLEYVLDQNQRRGLALALDMLTGDIVRTHLKQIVCEVVIRAKPTPGDWTRFERLAYEDSFVGRQVRWFLSQPGWLMAAARRDGVNPLLDSAFGREVASAVAACAADLPEVVASCLRPRIGDEHLGNWPHEIIQRQPDEQSIDFAVELLNQGALDDDAASAQMSDSVWFSLRFQFPPDVRVRWLAAAMARMTELCSQPTVADPVEALNRTAGRHGLGEALSDMAKVYPRGFLDAVLPFVVATSVASADPGEEQSLRKCVWRQTLRPVRHDFAEQLIDAICKAFGAVEWSPADVEAFSGLLEAASTETCAFLLSRVLVAQPNADVAFGWLLKGDNIRADWRGHHYRVATDVIVAHQHSVSEDALARFLAAVHEEVHEWERSPQGWRQRGCAEWELLLPFDEAVLPPRSRLRRQELIRKFGTDGPCDRAVSGGFVSSPIPQAATERMSDANWLSAMRRYQSPHDENDFARGGSMQVSQQLKARVEAEPFRFQALFAALPDDIPTVYRTAIIEALAGHIPQAGWAALVRDFLALHPNEMSTSLMWGAEKYEGPFVDELLSLVEIGASDPDPTPEALPAVEMPDRPASEMLATSGLNCVRGAAAHALARHIWGNPRDADRATKVLATLVADSSPAVRVAACDALGALSAVDREQAFGLFAKLLSSGVEPIGSHAGYELLRFASANDLGRMTPFIAQALESDDERVAEHAGVVWAHLVHWEKLPGVLEQDYRQLGPHARVGIARLWANNAHEDIDRARLAVEDEDERVREVVSQQLLNLTGEPYVSPGLVELLLDASDETFVASADNLIHGLESAKGHLPAAAAPVVDRILALPPHDGRGFPAGLLADLIIRLIREGDDDDLHLDYLDALIDQGRPLLASFDRNGRE